MRQIKLQCLVACIVVMGMACGASTLADTVKFAFKSQVYWIPEPWVASEGAPAPPFHLNVGDVVMGTIEFDPNTAIMGNDVVGQPYSITVQGSGWAIATEGFNGYVMDDRREAGWDCECPPSGPVCADEWILINDSAAGPTLPALDDRIELTRPVWSPRSIDARIPWAPMWNWQPAITLLGDTDILISDHFLPSDPDIWNAFSDKELRIGVVNRFNTLTARATILSFVEIPEPSSSIPIAIAAICGRLFCRKYVAGMQRKRLTA